MGSYQRARVLLVDDEKLVVDFLGRALRRHHQLTALRSAEDALVLLEVGARFDAILCDLSMPKFSGIDLYNRLKSTCPDQAARMIFVTGGATTRAAATFLEQAPSEPLYKPFEIEEALEAIEKLRRKTQARRLSTGNLQTVRT